MQKHAAEFHENVKLVQLGATFRFPHKKGPSSSFTPQLSHTNSDHYTHPLGRIIPPVLLVLSAACWTAHEATCRLLMRYTCTSAPKSVLLLAQKQETSSLSTSHKPQTRTQTQTQTQARSIQSLASVHFFSLSTFHFFLFAMKLWLNMFPS